METEKKPMRISKAIREKCLDCSCGSLEQVRNCSVEKCALFHFRMGKGFRAKKDVSETVKNERSERFKLMWEKRKAEGWTKPKKIKVS